MKLVQTLCFEIRVDVNLRMCSDSLSAVKVTTKRGCGRMRHLEVKRLWLQEETKQKRIVIEPRTLAASRISLT
eukprot:15007627-Heterocapsa_arctica.AAC.1